MKEWYKNSSHQMNDPEMEHLQSIDPASCAVWEWAKGMCKQRDYELVPVINRVEEGIIARRLGIDAKRFKLILTEMSEIGWIELGKEEFLLKMRGWDSWQSVKRTGSMDAKRKRDEYWKKKVEKGGVKLTVPGELQDERFLKKWREWISYRRSHPAPIADETIFFQKQLDWLEDFGAKKSTRILETTMRNNWQGLEAAAKIVEGG